MKSNYRVAFQSCFYLCKCKKHANLSAISMNGKKLTQKEFRFGLKIFWQGRAVDLAVATERSGFYYQSLQIFFIYHSGNIIQSSKNKGI